MTTSTETSSTTTTTTLSTTTTTTSSTTTTTTSSMTTTTTSSTATTITTKTTSSTPSCTNPNTVGAIFSIRSNTASTTYQLYTYTFNANDSSATLSFIITGESVAAQHYWLLDDVSVNDTVNNVNILVNGGFETGDFTGWTQYCATNANCGTNDYGQITTSPCHLGTYCYVDKCGDKNAYDYLIQSFSTVSGNTYILTFYLKVNTDTMNWFVYVMLS
ncbi:unnamed protein product [Rotaria sp. Silwood2]|nr:unnamed protein product [Rotaria sp. Silwood2]CAF3105174.1 unnamed protein product [Rotaria sp. Silwood2]CAF3322278.1 unnamed protein product [Rotaria sp. Silwood2]CAF4095853.1 unnamed protein product [Rotaria sp. Silwood2]CAF4230049.1 unnamed protein product [Rotaria sp. Silwood2]